MALMGAACSVPVAESSSSSPAAPLNSEPFALYSCVINYAENVYCVEVLGGTIKSNKPIDKITCSLGHYGLSNLGFTTSQEGGVYVATIEHCSNVANGAWLSDATVESTVFVNVGGIEYFASRQSVEIVGADILSWE